MQIIDRFLSEKQKREKEEAKYLSLVPTPVMVVDKDMNIIYMNPAGAEVTGVSQIECLGKKCFSLFKTDDCQTERCAVRRAMLEDTKVEEHTTSHARGLSIPIQYIGQPIKDATGNIVGGIEYVADMTTTYRVIDEVTKISLGLAQSSEQLAIASNQAGQATNQIAGTIQEITQGITQQSESITQTASTVEQMGRVIEGVAKGAQDQAGAISKAAQVTNQLSMAIQDVSTSAETQARGATESVALAQNSSQAMEETIQGMQRIQSKVDLTGQKVQEMGKHSDQIGMIVETIDDIASQTNLLALNAAIEAARAGEHGKGFAVVADEVRKLAEKSAGATKEITRLVKGIQGTVSEVVRAMNESAMEVQNGVALANQSGLALLGILDTAVDGKKSGEMITTAAARMGKLANELVAVMNSVSAVVEENTASTEEMAAGSSEVTRAIENIASVSEENSAAAEEVSASAEEMSAQVEEVSALAHSLEEMARTLRQVVAQFKFGQETQQTRGNSLPGKSVGHQPDWLSPSGGNGQGTVRAVVHPTKSASHY